MASMPIMIDAATAGRGDACVRGWGMALSLVSGLWILLRGVSRQINFRNVSGKVKTGAQ